MEFIRWHRFSYTIENGHLQIQSGLFNRQHRTIPLDRIQQVDIIQDGLSSVFGLAIVRCETAGTKVESEIELRYVGKDQANSIRKRLGETTSTATANSDPTVLYQASPRSLALRSLTTLHSKYVLLGLVTIVIGLSELLSSSLDRISVPSVMVGGPVIIADGILVVGIILVIAWSVGAVVTMFKYYDLTVTWADKTLRSSGGLLYDFTTEIPLEKVQMMRISANLLHRVFGYAELTVASAGIAEHKPWPFRKPLIPLDTRSTIETVARQILEYRDGSLQRPPKRMRRRYIIRYAMAICIITAVSCIGGLLWSGYISLFCAWPLVFLPVGPVLAHLTYRSRGIELQNDTLVLRRGVVRQHTYVVPIERVQTVTLSQSVFQRRLSLATVSIDTAAPFLSVRLRAVDFDAQTIESIYQDIKQMTVDTT